MYIHTLSKNSKQRKINLHSWNVIGSRLGRWCHMSQPRGIMTPTCFIDNSVALFHYCSDPELKWEQLWEEELLFCYITRSTTNWHGIFLSLLLLYFFASIYPAKCRQHRLLVSSVLHSNNLITSWGHPLFHPLLYHPYTCTRQGTGCCIRRWSPYCVTITQGICLFRGRGVLLWGVGVG